MSQYLYRVWAADGALLYVGISKSALRRLSEHLKTAPWACEVAKVTFEMHSSRQAVEMAERAAIARELPIYNVVHAKPGRLSMAVLPPPRGKADRCYFTSKEAADLICVTPNVFRKLVEKTGARSRLPSRRGDLWHHSDLIRIAKQSQALGEDTGEQAPC